jgi:anti-anti-sigma factor
VSEPSLLSVSCQVEGTAATIAVTGEFDLSGRPAFLAVFHRALDGGVDLVTIDASGLTFADSTALVALFQAREAAETRNVKFQLAPVSDALHRLLSLAGVVDAFGILEV